jgi:hypothetical protein
MNLHNLQVIDKPLSSICQSANILSIVYLEGVFVMLTIRRKVAYIIFAILAALMLLGGPAISTVFAGCQTSQSTSCT